MVMKMNDETTHEESMPTENTKNEMLEYQYVVGVSFKKALQVYYFGTNDTTLKVKDIVVVETARGIELGYVKTEVLPIENLQLKTEIKPVIRKATQEDLDKQKENEKLAVKAQEICLESISQLQLPMHLISSEYVIDTTKVIYTYVTDDRVDFSAL